MNRVRLGCPLLVLLYIISAEVLANLIDVGKSIKRVQIWDHGIKIVNFDDNSNNFLRYITCLNTEYEWFLKLCEDASSL